MPPRSLRGSESRCARSPVPVTQAAASHPVILRGSDCARNAELGSAGNAPTEARGHPLPARPGGEPRGGIASRGGRGVRRPRRPGLSRPSRRDGLRPPPAPRGGAPPRAGGHGLESLHVPGAGLPGERRAVLRRPEQLPERGPRPSHRHPALPLHRLHGGGPPRRARGRGGGAARALRRAHPDPGPAPPRGPLPRRDAPHREGLPGEARPDLQRQGRARAQDAPSLQAQGNARAHASQPQGHLSSRPGRGPRASRGRSHRPIQPGSAEDLRDRGVLYASVDCYGLAARDLESYLSLAPQAKDAEDLAARVALLRHQASRLN